MANTIDAAKLERQIAGKYGGAPDQGDHTRYWWWIDGTKYGGAKFSHGRKRKDLMPWEITSLTRRFKVTRHELKEMEQCTWGDQQRLEEQLTS